MQKSKHPGTIKTYVSIYMHEVLDAGLNCTTICYHNAKINVVFMISLYARAATSGEIHVSGYVNENDQPVVGALVVWRVVSALGVSFSRLRFSRQRGSESSLTPQPQGT